MQIYEKYIMKLLFARFWVVVFCVSVFGVFQETMKGELLAMCSFGQMMVILPLMLPFILFQFLPFLYFGVLLLVLTEIYSNNELISFKTIGIPNTSMMKVFFKFSCFVLIFFITLAIIYPGSNKLFLKQRNNFGVSNVLKTLKPKKINSIGKYNVFFTKIDQQNILYNVSIFTKGNQNKSNYPQNQKEKVFFHKVVRLGYNNVDEMIACCDDSDIIDLEFTNNNQKQNTKNTSVGQNTSNSENNDVLNVIKQSVKLQTMDVLLDDFFYTSKTPEIKTKQLLRQTGIITLWRKAKQNNFVDILYNLEIHGRAFVYWFVLLTLTGLSCLLLLRYNNRIKATKTTFFVIICTAVVSMTKAFVLQKILELHFVGVFYVCFLLITFGGVWCIHTSDIKTQNITSM